MKIFLCSRYLPDLGDWGYHFVVEGGAQGMPLFGVPVDFRSDLAYVTVTTPVPEALDSMTLRPIGSGVPSKSHCPFPSPIGQMLRMSSSRSPYLKRDFTRVGLPGTWMFFPAASFSFATSVLRWSPLIKLAGPHSSFSSVDETTYL